MILREIATFLFLYTLLVSVAVAAAPVQHQMEPIDPDELQQERIVDYLETGIPNCALCHASEQRPATDYRNDLECRQCHSADYSQQFLDIDERYKVPLKDRQYKVALAKPTSTPSSTAINTVKKTIIPDDMVLVPAGEFIMGTNDWWPKSGPEHSRHLPDYYMDKYEVTNAKYEKFVAATSHRLPDHWVKNGNKIPADQEEFPITFVSWQDAVDYCEWEGKRLPSEFEWEKAARGTDGRVFPWGDEFDKDKGNTPQHGHGKSMKVGSFDSGVSPYGLYDMVGNVFEWTSSWYRSYPGNTHNDPNEGETYRVVKGGSWYDCTYYRCGISAPTYNRIFFHPMTKNFTFGFRCAQDP
ncbi:hypothetical protein MNBD_GAMMA26-2285 [hydrothermal vent metagenome]|uniref:Sulfatase-modifying factor enzyme-like domain-containing protein n=1 Tax=hydrothermal vent metagenome TaxID=652676 RepID=A0A3B1ASW7_9ZZZZ